MALARLLVLAVLPLGLSLGACAATPAPAAPPTQSSPAASAAPHGLGYFVGAWRAAATDPATGKQEVLSYRVEPALDGSWIAGAGASSDLSFQARDMWGRDAETGGVIRIVFSGGGAFATFRAAGWTGDTLVFEGAVASKGSTLPLRQTITRIGPDEFRAVWEAKRDGAWRAYSVERLTRLPA